MDKKHCIDLIKAYKNPPLQIEDWFVLRYPWNKFGGFDICMQWYWFHDDVILESVTEREIAIAYYELSGKILGHTLTDKEWRMMV